MALDRYKVLFIPGLILLGAHFASLAASDVARHLLSAPVSASAGHAAPGDPEARSIRPFSEYQVIVSQNPFGGAAAVQEAALPEEELLQDVPVADSGRLSLLGTITSTRADERVAVVLDRGSGQEGIYREGESVGGALIRKIMRFRVLVSVNGADKVLVMDFLENGGTGGPDREPVASAGPSRRLSPGSGDQGPVTVSRKDVEFAMSNINTVLKGAAIEPVVQDGEVRGFRLDNIRPGSMFAKLRLRNGDVVQGVNGAPLTSPDEFLGLLTDIMTSSSFDITVKRGSGSREMSYVVE
jgi:general secretion pathway protein C